MKNRIYFRNLITLETIKQQDVTNDIEVIVI